MEKLRCRRRTPSKLRLLLLTLLHPGHFFFYMQHNSYDAPGDQIKASNKISYEDEDRKQEPESLGWGGGGSRL